MNKLIITNDKITKQVDETINIQIIKDILNIEFTDNSNLNIFYEQQSNYKLNVSFSNNIEVKIYEYKQNCKQKFQSDYTIFHNTKVNIYKFDLENQIENFDKILLNGTNSTINYVLKSVSLNSDYELNIFHNANDCTCKIQNNCFAKGDLQLLINNYIIKGIKNSNRNIQNKILNLGYECKLETKLFDDEKLITDKTTIEDINQKNKIINQQSLIGYNMNLFIKEFLCDNIDYDKAIIFKKYWR